MSAALLDDAAVEARSDASTSNLLLLLKDAAHKAVGGQLIPSRQEARSAILSLAPRLPSCQCLLLFLYFRINSFML